MYGRKENLYDILDLPRDADATAIALAHRRARADLELENAQPDARRAALLHEAYEILSDPDRRAAYDKSLAGANVFLAPGTRTVRPRWVGLGAGAVVIAAAVFLTLHKPAPPPSDSTPRSPAEIVSAASFSVGYVQAIDISGRGVPAGLAVAIADGVMVTTCNGLTAGTQLVVHLTERVAPASLEMVDEARDLCKLSVQGAGSRPVPLRVEMPRAGEKVYAVTFSNGVQVVRPATIRGILSTPKGKVIEIASPVPPAASGGPLIDDAGRLVGIMTSSTAFATGRNVALPASWLDNRRWIPK